MVEDWRRAFGGMLEEDEGLPALGCQRSRRSKAAGRVEEGSIGARVASGLCLETREITGAMQHRSEDTTSAQREGRFHWQCEKGTPSMGHGVE